MKPKYVYHGTTNGNIKIFEPRNPTDIGGNKNNKIKGIYATKFKQWTTIMGILANSGVKCSRIDIKQKSKITGVIYSGKPTHKYLYVYTFGSTDFKNIPRNGHQYICTHEIKPLKVEKFLVKDYLKWTRTVTEKEQEKLRKMVGNKKYQEIMK